LGQQQINELVFAIGLCAVADTPTPIALARIKRYLTSLDVYGNFPVLYSMYGSGGELAQGFSRSAAVAGATYKLGAKLVKFDESTGEATFNDGSRIIVSEKVVVSPENLAPPAEHESKSVLITRLVAFVAKDCREWFAENENAAIVVFPPETIGNNRYAVHALILGSGSGQCPDGQAAWYLSTLEPDESRARQDLQNALDKLEASILRESTEDFEIGDVAEGDVSYRPDGLPVVSSVKLGKSMQNFVPREKLQYLLKLGYHQRVAASDAALAPSMSSKLVQSPHVLSEMTYDGAVSVAKALYESIVGSDDDFFDVDFEDDEAVSQSIQRRDDQTAANVEASKIEDDFGHDMEL
jgi:RAB protein geranylgeranyltransferase component A